MPRLVLALLLLGMTACRTTLGRRDVVARDSGDVAIIEYGPKAAPAEHWTLAATPLADIGETDGDEAYLFTRVDAASLLPGGEVLVADRGTRDLRIFDEAGRLVRRIGRSGAGPGEFEELTWVGVDPSGAFTTYDRRLRRLSRFSSVGEIREIVSVPSPPDLPLGSVLGQFPDGSVVMRNLIGLGEDLARLSTGLVRDSFGLFLVPRDGAASIPIARFPGDQQVRAVGPGIIAMDPAPFGLQTSFAVTDSGIYVGLQETYEIRLYQKDGTLLRVMRRRVPPTPVSNEAKERWRQQWKQRLGRFKGPPPRQLTELEKYHSFPEVFPFHGGLRVDRVGNLWVEDYRPFPSADSVTTWLIFDPTGTIRSTAELRAAQVMDIGADRVVGVWHDADGVPHVRVQRLVKRAT